MKRMLQGPRTLLALAIAVIAATSPGLAHATDQSNFEKLIGRNAIGQVMAGVPVKPKGACLCNMAGLARRPGFLSWYADGTVYCLLPYFDAAGTLTSFTNCSDFAVLGH